MSEDLISRRAVIDFLREKVNLSAFMKRSIDKADASCLDICYRIQHELPSAQIDLSDYSDRLWRAAHERGKAEKQKNGEWIRVNIKGMDFVYCSECEDSYYPLPLDPGMFYCPHCGAYMEEGKDE